MPSTTSFEFGDIVLVTFPFTDQVGTEMTEGLIQRLTETSSIWLSDPHSADDLRPT